MSYIAEMKWGVRQRLEYIEERLFWWGRVNRGDLQERFGTSSVQASHDLSRYSGIAPDNLLYDRNEKTYLVTEIFQPVFINPSIDEYLRTFLPERKAIEGMAEQLPLPHRKIPPEIFRPVLHAVQNSTCVQVSYQSMSRPKSQERILAPHTFIHDGLRWHVRAFCFLTKTFRDFLLVRMLEVKEVDCQSPAASPGCEKDQDRFWATNIEIVLAPHPGLTSSQKMVLERDYGMAEGKVVITARQAHLPYLLRRLDLLEQEGPPARKQLQIMNNDQVAKWMAEVMPKKSNSLNDHT